MKIKPIRFKKSGTSKQDKDRDKDKEKGNVQNVRRSGNADRVNRTVYVTVAVLLIVLSVAIAMTSAANKTKRNTPSDTSEKSTGLSPRTEDQTVSPAPDTTSAPAVTGAPHTDVIVPAVTDNVPVVEEIPTLSLPVNGKITREHDPSVQVFSPTLEEWRVHLGIDIMAEVGSPVCAAADGKIKSVTEDAMYGTCIEIEHTAGAVTVYKNLSDTLPDGIKAGKAVRAGQLIGAVGDGCIVELADEPHLHFEMTVNGEQVDPMEYFSAADAASLKIAADSYYEN